MGTLGMPFSGMKEAGNLQATWHATSSEMGDASQRLVKLLREKVRTQYLAKGR